MSDSLKIGEEVEKKIGPYTFSKNCFNIEKTLGQGTFGKVKLAIHEPT